MASGLISHADKVLFAERGETKGDLADHYERVAEPLMRVMGGRPVLLQRFPEGAFFQKRVPKNAPDWLQTTTVATPNGTTSQALVAADLDHLLWAVNLGCLGFHVWPFLAAAGDEHADELRMDLDPTPRRPATAGCTSTCASNRSGIPTRCAPPLSRSPESWSGAGPT